MLVSLIPLIAGCASSPPPTNADADVATEPAPAAAAEGATSAVSSTLLLDVVAGRTPPGAIIDPQRGFVFVEVDNDAPDDPRADARGRVREARRVCADDAHALLERLTSDLRERTNGGKDDVFACVEHMCTHPPRVGDQADRAGSYAFQSPDGKPVLAVVVRMGHEAATPGERKALEKWVDFNISRLLGEACPRDEPNEGDAAPR